jgi:HSP20 family protein
MPMRNWDPFTDLDTLRREIDRALGESGARPGARAGRPGFLPGRGARQYPLVNVYDDGERYVVEALAPGVDPEKLEVNVVRSTLTISGEKLGPSGVAPERVHRNERAAGRFVRTVDLPVEVEPSQVTAQYRNGLLVLALPRAEAARPRRVTVQAE